jgi:hypothetical protein
MPMPKISSKHLSYVILLGIFREMTLDHIRQCCLRRDLELSLLLQRRTFFGLKPFTPRSEYKYAGLWVFVRH